MSSSWSPVLLLVEVLSGALGSRFVSREGFLHCAVRLIDGDIRICVTIRIGVRNGDAPKGFPANYARALLFGAIERFEERVVFIGVSVRPAVYGDRLDVSRGVEVPTAQHAAQLIANFPFEHLKGRREQLIPPSLKLVFTGESWTAGCSDQVQETGFFR
jgi:hypothetical protein